MSGDPSTSWFEPLYEAAGDDPSRVPWARLAPRSTLLRWADARAGAGSGRSAVVVGAGLGDDAEELARRGFAVTAFDIAPSAVAWARRRFPGSSVDYVVADLAAPPEAWAGAFDLVLESYTLQSVPADLRARLVPSVAGLVAPGGTLVVVAIVRERGEPAGDGPPWRLTYDELAAFERLGLQLAWKDEAADRLSSGAVVRVATLELRGAV